MGNVFFTLRFAMGDYDFDGSIELEDTLNYFFWIIWLMLIIITNIIFLNFIICEATNSYNKVKDFLSAEIYKERGNLVVEAEQMLP